MEIASYTESCSVGRGTAPLVIDAKGVKASWIKVDASVLSARGYDGRYVLQFSEILVFHGDKNVALRQQVTSSTVAPKVPSPWNNHFVVDGFVPYVMDAATGKQSPLLS